jgi:hypothetical protein
LFDSHSLREAVRAAGEILSQWNPDAHCRGLKLQNLIVSCGVNPKGGIPEQVEILNDLHRCDASGTRVFSTSSFTAPCLEMVQLLRPHPPALSQLVTRHVFLSQQFHPRFWSTFPLVQYARAAERIGWSVVSGFADALTYGLLVDELDREFFWTSFRKNPSLLPILAGASLYSPTPLWWSDNYIPLFLSPQVGSQYTSSLQSVQHKEAILFNVVVPPRVDLVSCDVPVSRVQSPVPSSSETTSKSGMNSQVSGRAALSSSSLVVAPTEAVSTLGSPPTSNTHTSRAVPFFPTSGVMQDRVYFSQLAWALVGSSQANLAEVQHLYECFQYSVRSTAQWIVENLTEQPSVEMLSAFSDMLLVIVYNFSLCLHWTYTSF